MSSDKTLLTVATIAFVLALASAIVSLSGGFTGYASQDTDTGEANLTVQKNLEINFTTDSVNWGSGYVYSNATSATLDTRGNVTNGTNWNSVTDPLVLENQGNVNASINLSSGTDADGFIGGGQASDAPDPVYNWSINDPNGACVGSLSNDNGYYNVNKSGEIICDNMAFPSNTDDLEVDLRVVVPYDADRTSKTDTLTAVATAKAN